MMSPDNSILVKTHFVRPKGHGLSHRSVTLVESYKWENIYEVFPSRYLYFGRSFFQEVQTQPLYTTHRLTKAASSILKLAFAWMDFGLNNGKFFDYGSSRLGSSDEFFGWRLPASTDAIHSVE